jgi:hypothetical protein
MPAVKNVGEPCAGEPHARIDGGREETGTSRHQPRGARRLSPTRPTSPPRHRRRWRSTNLLERSLGEVKRRTKVMGRFPGEESCLTLVWAVLDLLITHQTNGIQFNALDPQRLKRMRYEEDEQTIPEEVTAA